MLNETNIENFTFLDKQGLQGSPIYVYESVNSTQEVLKLIHSKIPPYSCVTAREQTMGVGRRQRPWIQTQGKDLAFSFSLDFPEDPDFQQKGFLPQIITYSLREFIEEKYGFTLDLKWPNDLMHENFKIAGVLLTQVESPLFDHERVLVGIGINVNSNAIERDALDRKTASLCEIIGREIDLDDFLSNFLQYLNFLIFRIQKHPKEVIPGLLNAFSIERGRKAQIQFNDDTELKEYEIIGVEEGGSLIVQEEGQSFMKILKTIEKIEY